MEVNTVYFLLIFCSSLLNGDCRKHQKKPKILHRLKHSKLGHQLLKKVAVKSFFKKPKVDADLLGERMGIDRYPGEEQVGLVDQDQTFDSFEQEPIFWSENKGQKKNSNPIATKCKKNEACSRSEEGPTPSEDGMPSTALPNPNIFGGFPENDIWGNFELPPASVLNRLKARLKYDPSHRRPNYAEDQSDGTDQIYNYETHALPEYEILETPPFQAVLSAQQAKEDAEGCTTGATSCPFANYGVCAHYNALCSKNAKKPKVGQPEFEGPCASKILEMFGCKPKSIQPQAFHPHAVAGPHTSMAVSKKPTTVGLVKTEQKAPVVDDTDKKLENSILVTEKELKKVMQSIQTASQKKTEKAQTRQHSHKHKHGKIADDSRLLKVEESLELMAALGRDLQKNFAVLHRQDVRKDNKLAMTSTDKSTDTNHNNYTDAELASYFNEATGLDSLTDEAREGQRLYSDWSSWSKCSSQCARATVSRRRNCLTNQCNGNLVEKKPCVNKHCTNKTINHQVNDQSDGHPESLLNTTERNALENILKVGQVFSLASIQPVAQPNGFSTLTDEPKTQEHPDRGASGGKTADLSKYVSNTVLVPESTKTTDSNHTGDLSNKVDLPSSISPELMKTIDKVNSQPHVLNTSKQSEEDAAIDKLISHFTTNVLDESVKSAAEKEATTTPVPSIGDREKLEKAFATNEESKYDNKTDDMDDSDTLKIVNLLSKKLADEADREDGKNGLPASNNPDLILNTISSIEKASILNADKLVNGEDPNFRWSEWSDCSTTCGIGHSLRTLDCYTDKCKGQATRSELKPCRVVACEDTELESALKSNCLPIHNDIRRRHSAENLEWSDDLYRKALEISDRMALSNIPANNISLYERPGLNLAYVSTPQNVVNLSSSCIQAVNGWYQQKLNYNYNNPKLGSEDHDFTQLVWKSSKKIGIAKSPSSDNLANYVAAVYEPAGNVDSYYDIRKNVMSVPTGPDIDILKDLFGTVKKSFLGKKLKLKFN